TPKLVMIAMTVATITRSTVEKPVRVVRKLVLLFRIRIIMVQKFFCGRGTTVGPLSNRGARKVLSTKKRNAISCVDRTIIRLVQIRLRESQIDFSVVLFVPLRPLR